MKLPRTVRLDSSDTKVFARTAEPGEWAVPGAFRFAGADPASLDKKARQSFKSAWLGLDGFGDATIVEAMDISADQYEACVRALATHFIERYGAPDILAAAQAAREELAYAASLAEHPNHTLLILEREPAEGGGVSERVRVVVKSRAGDHARVWEIGGEPVDVKE
ncbi:MAG: DUF6505 family protein [Tagaea sp.]